MSAKYSLTTLTGLEGMPTETKAARCFSVSDAIAKIRRHRAVTQAGDNGSITVWRNKSGLQVEFDRFKIALSRESPRTVAELREWLKTWWKELGR